MPGDGLLLPDRHENSRLPACAGLSMGACMAPPISTNSLAQALSKGAPPAGRNGELGHGDDPLIHRLATALAVLPPHALPEHPDEDDDVDEDLDLPMLVQGSRVPVIVPLPPIQQRAREGRAALVGFGLGLILLVPIGVVMSNRLPEPAVGQADLTTLPTTLMPGTVMTLDAGLRSIDRSTAAAPPIEVTPVSPTVATDVAQASAVTIAAIPAHETTTPKSVLLSTQARTDLLADAADLIVKGDIVAARLKIQAANPESNPQAALAMAETFDPNMLAAWGIRGADADVERARGLYGRALGSGILKARNRLEALD